MKEFIVNHQILWPLLSIVGMCSAAIILHKNQKALEAGNFQGVSKSMFPILASVGFAITMNAIFVLSTMLGTHNK